MENTKVNDRIAPTPKGKHDLRVDMYFLGAFIGSALVVNCWSQRSARLAAFRGIATSIYPMTDRDRIVFTKEKHE